MSVRRKLSSIETLTPKAHEISHEEYQNIINEKKQKIQKNERRY